MTARPLTVLCVGDVFGEPGRRAIETLLPRIKKQYDVDLAVVNVENAAAGAGVTPPMAKGFLEHGVDVMTSGNHIWDKKEIVEYIVKENLLLRPANYPPGTPGTGSIVVKAGPHKVAVLNMMGRVFLPLLDCPFRKADEEIPRLRQETPIIVVDMHCEATSESQAMGWYLDGRVSFVFGTHTHVPTADTRVFPGGTAFVSDLGMVGPRDSVIGMDKEASLQRFLTGVPYRFKVADGPVQFNSVLVRIDALSGKADAIERVDREVEVA